MTPTRIVIADDDPVAIHAMQSILSEDRDFEVVATCSDGEEALRAVSTHKPDVLVLDLLMPGLDALGVARELQGASHQPRVVIVAMALSDNAVIQAIRLGVRGIVLKPLAPKMLAPCVRKVSGGQVWLELESAARVLELLVQHHPEMAPTS
jgi:DNA-binding NarL/FixJ family response regulator